jgi:hypothetical protein
MTIDPILPTSCAEIRREIFEGSVFLTRSSEASRGLVESVVRDMQAELDTTDIRTAHQKWSDTELFERFGKLRRHFFLSPEYHERLREVVEACGFERSRVAFDPIRIRVVLPGGHRNPKAAPVYYPHRDTWYAHPQSLVVWWVPLHDLRSDETFEFYPNDFDREVANDSEIFDYGVWVKDGPALKIGWQKRDSGETANYPRAGIEPNRTQGVGFACKAAENLIFSGAHFHQTLPQDSDTIRYSLDFRVVHLDDIDSGDGAPNVDNRSRGSTFNDYIQPVSSVA